MTKRTRVLLVLAAVTSAALTALMFLISVGGGLSAAVSNCNRNCDDGTRAMYAAFVFGGLTIVFAILATLGRTARPPR